MTYNQFFRSITIVFYALIAGQVMFLAATCFILNFGQILVVDSNFTLKLLIAETIFTVIGIWGSTFFFNKALNKAKTGNTFLIKLNGYREAFIIRFALLEAPSFAGIVFFLITGNYQFIVFPILLIALFIWFRPKKENIISELELTYTEQNYISNPDMIIE